MKIYKVIGFLATVALLFAVSACGNKPISANEGDKEVSLPFSSKEYRSNKDYFRAVNSGVSPDMTAARKIAMLNARTELAGTVSSTIKAVSEQYLQNTTISDRQEFAAKFEETSRNVVNQEIQNVVVMDEKVFKSKEGKYTYWIVLEMPKEQISKSVENAITKDEKLAVEFDKFLFQKTFDAEMAKME